MTESMRPLAGLHQQQVDSGSSDWKIRKAEARARAREAREAASRERTRGGAGDADAAFMEQGWDVKYECPRD